MLSNWRHFGVSAFCGFALLAITLWTTTAKADTGLSTPLEKADTLIRRLYRRNNDVPADQTQDSEMATGSVTHSNNGQKLHSIVHNIHGVPSDGPGGDPSAVKSTTDPMAGVQAAPSNAEHQVAHENPNAHKPWLLFHLGEGAERMNGANTLNNGEAQAMNSENNGLPEDESLALDSEGMWFVMVALITGGLNLSSCIYIMVKTWPDSSSDSPSQHPKHGNGAIGIDDDDHSKGKNNQNEQDCYEQNKSIEHETNAASFSNVVSFPTPLQPSGKPKRLNFNAVLSTSAPNLSSSRYDDASGISTTCSEGAVLHQRHSLARQMKRSSTLNAAKDAAIKIKSVASRGPWRWSAAAWNLEAYAESEYSNSRTSLVTINSVESSNTLSAADNQNNNGFSNIPLSSDTKPTNAGHLSRDHSTPSLKDETSRKHEVAQHHRRHHHHSKHKHVASRHRFALYTTTTDLAITAIVTGGALYASIRGELPSDGWCRALGLANYALIAMDLALVAFESILFWSAVSQLALPLTHYHSMQHKHGLSMTESTAAHHSLQELDHGSSRSLGRYHWKLWLACTVAPWVLSLSLLPAHGFGWDRYWCFVYNYSAGGKGALAFMVLLHYTVLLIVSLCYIPVLRATRQLPHLSESTTATTTALPQMSQSENTGSQHRSQTLAKLNAASSNLSTTTLSHSDELLQHRRLAHHRHVVEGAGITLTHLLLQVVHYTPGTLHVAAQFFDYEDLWIYIVAVAFTQSGALMHALVIGWSEWRERRNS
ncbi:hypothetical protein BDF19DRAFT_412221 [Syncephalis fuscata]|nr:hypothetical protein BDF19DRAFT_412221 [Syncephalis fuscata]